MGLDCAFLSLSPNSPVLAPSDFHLLFSSHRDLDGKTFVNNEKVERLTDADLTAKDET